MPERTVTRNATSAEVFSRLQVRAVGEFERGDLFSSFHFDAGNLQKSFAAAADQQFAPFETNLARRKFGCMDFRHRLALKLASGVVEVSVGAGSGGEGAHAVEDCLCEERPIDAPVSLF